MFFLLLVYDSLFPLPVPWPVHWQSTRNQPCSGRWKLELGCGTTQASQLNCGPIKSEKTFKPCCCCWYPEQAGVELRCRGGLVCIVIKTRPRLSIFADFRHFSAIFGQFRNKICLNSHVPMIIS